MKHVFFSCRVVAKDTPTHKQTLINWQQAIEEFHDCYQRLKQQQHLLSNCPPYHLTQLIKTMHIELLRLICEADQFTGNQLLVVHTEKLRELIQKAQVNLWLAGAIPS